MPAHRKPTAVLEASGAFKSNPSRRRQREPDSGRGVGPAPADMSDAQKATWNEIVADCAAGVFQSGDRVMLEALVVLVDLFRRDREAFSGRKHQQMMALLVRCGMTPADRSRIVVEPEAADSAERPLTGLASFRKWPTP